MEGNNIIYKLRHIVLPLILSDNLLISHFIMIENERKVKFILIK